MRLIIEEVLANEEFKVEKVKALTGEKYEHYEFKYKWNNYCVVSIIKAGCAMIDEVFTLMPGVPVAKILIQRDEKSANKDPINYFDKIPKSISQKERVFILDPMLATGGSVSTAI